MRFFLAFLSGVLSSLVFPFVPYSAVLFVSAACLELFRRKMVILVALLALGMLWGFLRPGPGDLPNELFDREILAEGRFVHQDAGGSGYAGEADFAVDEAFDAESGEELEELEGRDIRLVGGIPEAEDPGYILRVRTGRDLRRHNPGGYSGERIWGKVTGVEQVTETDSIPPAVRIGRFRDRLHEYLLARFDRDSAALVAAVTTGETRYLSDDLRTAFNRSGLAHILSISGTHFGLFSVLLFAAFLFLIHRLPYGIFNRLTLLMTPPQASAIFSLPFMVLYLALSGGSVPAVRSFTMVSLFLFGLLLGRKGQWLNSLLLAAVLLVIWDPAVLAGLSFQLSFIAVLFIGFSVDRNVDRNEEKNTGGRLTGWIGSSLRLTLAATAGTAPLVAYWFHYFSLVSPVANVLVAPVIGFGVVPLAVISSFGFLVSGTYLFAPVVGLMADISIALVRWSANIPHASLTVPRFPPVFLVLFYGYFFACFAFSAGRRQMRDASAGKAPGHLPKTLLLVPFLPFLVLALVHVVAKKDLSITFLDVGQGDAAVVELPDRRTVVIDTGRTGREIIGFLRHAGKEEVDALVLTHIHPDHTGGLETLLASLPVREIWDNGLILYPEAPTVLPGVRHLERGDMIGGEGAVITVLHPHPDFYTRDGDSYDEENNSSLVLKVAGNRGSVLFAGDIGWEATEDMLHLGDWLRSDVIKVPHHGSRESADEEFLRRISPEIAVISVGRDNAYGHPDSEVLDVLSGTRVFRTDRDGAVKITETEEGLSVRTYREFIPEPAGSFRGELKNLRWLLSVW